MPLKLLVGGAHPTRLSLQTVPSQEAQPTQQRCVNEQGFSLHAEVRCAITQRHTLEHLCRYITRPAIANERLTLNHAGQRVLTLKTPYREGTTHRVMSSLAFMQRLAALVPRPRLPLIRFHSVLAPNARLRSEIIPSAPLNANATADDQRHAFRSLSRQRPLARTRARRLNGPKLVASGRRMARKVPDVGSRIPVFDNSLLRRYVAV
jgi:Putative transposase.